MSKADTAESDTGGYSGKFDTFREVIANIAATAHRHWRTYITKYGPCRSCSEPAVECAELTSQACCDGCSHPFLSGESPTEDA